MDPADYKNTQGKIVEEDGNPLFIPGPIPPTIKYDARLALELNHAERLLGELKYRMLSIPGTSLLGMIFLQLEAVGSSQIEGTEATFDDMLKYRLGKVSNRDVSLLRIQEVVNYKMILSEMQKSTEPLNLESIRAMHKNLFTGVDQNFQFHGRFRLRQNWIGGGGNMANSTYNPPPYRHVQPLMEEVVSFINGASEVPDLIRCAIAHYQFEAIHPFHDGNGRIGRIIVSIMLARMVGLSWPLDISVHIKRDQLRYYNRLLRISTHSEWNEWILFFVRIISDAAKGIILRVERLSDLTKKYRQMSSRTQAIRMIDLLLEIPYITIPETCKHLQMSYPGAKDLVKEFIELGILVEVKTEKKPRLFCAKDILDAITSMEA